MPEKLQFTVEEDSAGIRLDVFLKEFLPAGNSRTRIKKIIEEGLVIINDEICKSAHHKVKIEDSIDITVPEVEDFSVGPEDIPLDILYEDDDLMFINKPPGIVVHPGEGNRHGTLVNALLNHTKSLSSINSSERPGIVHRLDKETSGVMVVAKNNATHLKLSEQFADHSINRIYIALVEGKVEFEEGDIDLPLGRHPKDRKKIAVRFIDGREAKTYYRVIKRFDKRTLLELKPYTGRTHQLRVHLSHEGHTILGDDKYGKKSSFPRLALHAQTLGLTHPGTGKYIEHTVQAPLEFSSPDI